MSSLKDSVHLGVLVLQQVVGSADFGVHSVQGLGLLLNLVTQSYSQVLQAPQTVTHQA